jgi:hypothetical protein
MKPSHTYAKTIGNWMRTLGSLMQTINFCAFCAFWPSTHLIFQIEHAWRVSKVHMRVPLTSDLSPGLTLTGRLSASSFALVMTQSKPGAQGNITKLPYYSQEGIGSFFNKTANTKKVDIEEKLTFLQCLLELCLQEASSFYTIGGQLKE